MKPILKTERLYPRKMEHIEIYKAADADTLNRCLKIRNKVFTMEKGVPKEIEVDEYDCLNQSCNHFLIQYRNHDAGTIRCLYTSHDTIQIQRFCFLKEYRNLGLGRTFIAYIEDYYRDLDVKKIEMDAKYEVSGFYEKCGYKKVSEIFIEADVEHVKMIKQL